MADRLEHTEQVRRQMLSDLAHEMGTPLSVLTVYLDGLQDGVVDWNNATHTIMADQLTRLTRLMEDIDDVSRAQEHRIDLDLVEEGSGICSIPPLLPRGKLMLTKASIYRSRPLQTPPGCSWTGNASAR